jgi:hypothetical protein
LLVILCPDKPTFYPEYIPARYRKNPNKLTNAGYFAKRCADKGINVIDFNPWFLAMKSRSPFPLIPKTGVHWSYYGAYLAADSMARYLREKTGYPVPRIILDSISKPDFPIGEDNDMGATLNLIWGIPCPKLGYPKFHAPVNSGLPKPSALFVGDSFYWNWYNSGMIKTLFSNSDFWYYCKDVYPRADNKSLTVSEIDAENVIKKQNIIVLIQVNGAYGNPGYGFTEIAQRGLDPDNDRLLKAERMILTHPQWVEDIKKKAKEVHVTFEKQLQEDALWLINFEDKHKK